MERRQTKNLTSKVIEKAQGKPEKVTNGTSEEEKEKYTEEFICKREKQFKLVQKMWNKMIEFPAQEEGGADTKRNFYIQKVYEAVQPVLAKFVIKNSKKEIELLSDPTNLPGFSLKDAVGNVWRKYKASKTDFFLKDMSSILGGISDYDSFVRGYEYDLSSLLAGQQTPLKEKKWLKSFTPEMLLEYSEITEALDQNVIHNMFTEKEMKNAVNSILGRYYNLDSVDFLRINPNWTIPTYVHEIKEMTKKKTFTPEKLNEVFCQLLFLVPHLRLSRYNNYEPLFGWRYHDPLISDPGQPEIRLSQVASFGHYFRYSINSIIDDKGKQFVPSKEKIEVLEYQSLRTGQLNMLKDYIKLLRAAGLFELHPKSVSETKESF